MSAYNVVSIDLTVARSVPEVIESTRNNPVATVSVISLPAGADVSIHFSQGGQAIPLLNQGMEFALLPAETQGVFVSNPAGSGTLVLLLSYESAPVVTGRVAL